MPRLRLIVNRRARIGPAGHRLGRGVAPRGILEVVRVISLRVEIFLPHDAEVRRLIPLVDAGQKIGSIFVAVKIGSSRRPCLVAGPKRHAPNVLVHFLRPPEGQVVGCRVACARVEPVDEGRRLVPTDISRRLVSRPCPSRHINHPAGRGHGDVVLRNLVSAHAVFVGHRAKPVRISWDIREADRNERDGELVGARTKGVCAGYNSDR